jgi:hypothetical protein
MAARRLIIVLLVLFAVSIVAAMIAPERRGPLLGDRSSSSTDSTSSTTTTTSEATTTDELPSGEALTARIEASESKPESVKAFVGDQLELSVGSRRSREIQIPAFGITETAAPDAPATFNLLFRDAGKLPIIDADSGELLGRLDVSDPRGAGAGASGRGGKPAKKPK